MKTNIIGAKNELQAQTTYIVAISDYRTGVEIWRGEMSAWCVTRYEEECNGESGACEAVAFLGADDMLEIGAEPHDVVVLAVV